MYIGVMYFLCPCSQPVADRAGLAVGDTFFYRVSQETEPSLYLQLIRRAFEHLYHELGWSTYFFFL